ncbi:MAG: hypothetical protein JSV61_08140 [Anaerolineales bacterium]|nr:MAG: hypothetical protein JSV61_08140 [Anaerolineales bacterium]
MSIQALFRLSGLLAMAIAGLACLAAIGALAALVSYGTIVVEKGET